MMIFIVTLLYSPTYM